MARLRKKLILSLVSLAAALAVAEFVARQRFGTPGWFQQPPGLAVEFRPQPDVMPGVSGVSRFMTNSMGLRARELAVGQELRVLSVGGSTTACDYLDQSETWPAVLEELLWAQLGEGLAWVGNAGGSGFNARDHLLQLEHLAPSIPELDVILCLVGVNDVSNALQHGGHYQSMQPAATLSDETRLERVFPERPIEFSWIDPRRSAMARLFQRMRQKRWQEEGAREDTLGQNYVDRRRWRQAARPHRSEAPDTQAAEAEYRANLLELVRIARAGGTRLILLTQPVMWKESVSEAEDELLWFGWIGSVPWEEPSGYYDVKVLDASMRRFNQILREVARETGTEVVDLARDLPRTTAVFYDDCHFNEAGARKVAEHVLPALLP